MARASSVSAGIVAASTTRRRVADLPPEIPASSWFRLGWALITVGAVVSRALTVSSWSYFQDDWVYVSAAADTGLLTFVVQDYNSHLMPLGLALVWLSTHAAPLDYAWVVYLACALTTWMLVAWGLALRELFGERLAVLTALVLLGLGPVQVMVGLWWAASLQYLPLQATCGTCIWLLARLLLRGHEPRDMVGLNMAFLLGLLFWQKAILIVIPLIFVAVMVSAGSWRQRVHAAARLLLPTLAMAAVYVAIYVFVPRRSLETFATDFPEPRSPGQILEFVGVGLLDTALPALIGGPFTVVSDAYGRVGPAPTTIRVLVVVLAIAAIAAGLRWGRRTVPALLMAATYACTSWSTILFSTRYDTFGVDAVYEGRYLCDILPVLLLAVMLAAMPLRTELGGSRPMGASRAGRIGSHAVAVGALLVASLAGAVSARSWAHTQASSPKPWVDNLVGDVSSAPNARLFDSVAPDNVINPVFMLGRANLSDLLRPLGLPLTFNEPTANGLLVTDARGRLFEGEVLSPAVAAVTPGPVDRCGYLIRPAETTSVPLTAGIYSYEWVVQLDYFAAAPGQMTSSTDSESSSFSLPATPAGALSRIHYVVVDSVSRLDLSLAPDAGGPVCVTDVKVGLLAPTERRPKPLGPVS